MCWGSNHAGQCGHPPPGGFPPVAHCTWPLTVLEMEGRGAVAVAAGHLHTAALTATGRVYAWGACATMAGHTIKVKVRSCAAAAAAGRCCCATPCRRIRASLPRCCCRASLPCTGRRLAAWFAAPHPGPHSRCLLGGIHVPSPSSLLPSSLLPHPLAPAGHCVFGSCRWPPRARVRPWPSPLPAGPRWWSRRLAPCSFTGACATPLAPVCASL